MAQSAEANVEERSVERLDDEEEFLEWKRNTPSLYDVLIMHTLEWSSLTCHFRPTASSDSTEVIVGTSNPEREQNSLMVMDIHLPEPGKPIDRSSLPKKLITVKQRINHLGDVHKARYSPTIKGLLASKSDDGSVYVFQLNTHPDVPEKGFVPQLTLDGHTASGFGLDWRLGETARVMSSDDEGTICIWDLDKTLTQKFAPISSPIENRIIPMLRIQGNGQAVNEVKFHKRTPDLFGGVSDDSSVTLYDLRSGGVPFMKVMAHPSEVYALDFSPKDDFLFLTGAADGVIKLWDMRKLTRSIHDFEGHEEKVLRIEWNPSIETLFMSASEDRKVIMWDCSKIGDDLQNEEHQEGPTELLFRHKGHREKVEDIAWNPHRDLGVLSVDGNNMTQYWEMDEDVFYDD